MGIDPAQLNDRQRLLIDPADRKKLGKRGETFAQADNRRVTRTERHIHDQFIAFLRRHDLDYIHSNPTRKSSIAVGTPDFFVGPVANRGFFIEFKVPPNGLTAEQKQKIAALQRKNNTVLVAVETSQGAAYTAAIRETAKFFNLDISLE